MELPVYWECGLDEDNNIYSIDNVNIEYDFYDIGTSICDLILEKCRSLKNKYDLDDYWEKNNMLGVAKYWFAKDFIHFGKGIKIYLGSYCFMKDDTGKRTRSDVLPVMHIEINPNKYAREPVFVELLNFIKSFPSDSYLIKYDLAIDIRRTLDDVQIFSTKKSKSYFDNTRYYGKKNKNGRCKIYDKAKEQNLDMVLTRVEHTLVCGAKNKNLSLEKVYFSVENSKPEDPLTENDMIIFKALDRLRTAGLEYQDILDQVNFRKRKKIIAYMQNSGFKELQYDFAIIDGLLSKVRELFACVELTEERFIPETVPDDDIPFE